MSRTLSVGVVIVILLGGVDRASAGIITFDFTGVITDNAPFSIPLPPSTLPLPAIGTPFSGSFSFDTGATDIEASSSSSTFLFPPPSAPLGVTLTVGSLTFSTDSNDYVVANVQDFPASERLRVIGDAVLPVGWSLTGGFTSTLLVDLRDDGNALSSDALPIAVNLSDFDLLAIVAWDVSASTTNPAIITHSNGTTIVTTPIRYQGQIQTLTQRTSEVPEPTSLYLLCIGSVTLLRYKRRRGRRATAAS